MLPSVNRMRRSSDFAAVIRAGERSRRGNVVVHHHVDLAAACPPLVGLVVGKSVGNSVVRHQVSRKLRAQLTRRLSLLPPGSGTVVRALPAAAASTSGQIGADLDAALMRLAGRR